MDAPTPIITIGIRGYSPGFHAMVKGNSYIPSRTRLSRFPPAPEINRVRSSHNRGESARVEDAIDLSRFGLSRVLGSTDCALQQVRLIWILCGTNDRLLLSNVAPFSDAQPRGITFRVDALNIWTWWFTHRVDVLIKYFINFVLSVKLLWNVKQKGLHKSGNMNELILKLYSSPVILIQKISSWRNFKEFLREFYFRVSSLICNNL